MDIKYKIVGDKIIEIHKICVFKITIPMNNFSSSDERYSTEKMLANKWQASAQYEYIISHIDQPATHHWYDDHACYERYYQIYAELEGKYATEFYLKWGNECR